MTPEGIAIGIAAIMLSAVGTGLIVAKLLVARIDRLAEKLVDHEVTGSPIHRSGPQPKPFYGQRGTRPWTGTGV